MKKRLLSLIMFIAVISGFMAAPVYAVDDEDFYLLKAIGVYDGEISDEEITRAEFVKYLARAAYSVDFDSIEPEGESKFTDVNAGDDGYAEIKYMADLNIVKGISENYFGASEHIFTKDALRLVGRVLRYDLLSTDPLLSLTDSVVESVKTPLNSPLTERNALEIISAMLDAGYVEYKGTNEIEISEISYLEGIRKIKKIKGVVYDNGKISVDGGSTIGSDEIKIGDLVLTFPKEEKEDYFGLYVTAYYNTESEEVVAIYANSKNRVIELKNIEKFEDFCYYYYQDELSSGLTKAKIKEDACIVYNGRSVKLDDPFESSMFVPDCGRVILYDIDRDNLFDYVFIEENETYVVSAADAQNEIISTKNKGGIIEYNEDWKFYNLKGEEITPEKLAENNILFVQKDFSGKYVKVIVSDKIAEDAVISIVSDEENPMIETEKGGKYELSDYFIKGQKMAADPEITGLDFPKLELRGVYQFYLDPYEAVAFARKINTDDEWIYASLIKTVTDEFEEEKVWIKVYKTDGDTAENYEIADKVKVYFKDGTDSKIKRENFAVAVEGECGFMRFKLNDESKVSELEFPVKKGVAYQGNDRLFEIDNSGDTEYWYSSYWWRIMGTNVYFRHNFTKLFYIPNDLTETEKYKTGLVGITNSPADGNIKYVAYTDVKNSLLAKWLIFPGKEMDGSTDDYPMIISKIYQEINSETDEAHTYLEGYRKGVAVKYYLEDNSLADNVPGATGGETKYKLAVGDIIFAEIEDEERILSAKLIFDASEGESGKLAGITGEYRDDATNKGNPYCLNSEENITNHAYFTQNVRYIMDGYLYSFVDNIPLFTNQNLKSGAEYEPENPIYNSITYSYKNAVVVNKKGSKYDIKPATATDMRSFLQYGSACSRCIVIAEEGTMCGLFIYND